jgi:hypothetical protein
VTVAATVQRLVQDAVLGADPTLLSPALVEAGAEALGRIEVYREHFVESLTVALGEVYPVTRRLVGESCFRRFARAHLDARPPLDPRLSRYGDAFASTIDEVGVRAKAPYLADVARLEWALHEAGDAAAAPCELPDTCAVTADARVRFVRSMRLLRSDWPIDSIWRAHHGAEFPGDVFRLEARPGFVQVASDVGGPYIRSLTAGEYVLRERLVQGSCLGQSAAAALAAEAGMDLTRALVDLFAGGIVAAVEGNS